MSTYVIGDVQGCFDPLQRLLAHCGFDPAHDRLWFVGDLVNRGPQSAAVLRFIMGLGKCAVVTLGNHDLHLLVVAAGHARPHRGDTLDDILSASDREALLDWLRHCPLLHVEHGVAMVHAGLLPQWSIEEASQLAREAEAALRGPQHAAFLGKLYGNAPVRWSAALSGWDRLRVIVNAMTRLRLCTADGTMEFEHKGEPRDIPRGYLPWFDVPGRRSADTPVIFGHWSALGLIARPDCYAIDTGCLWGRALTALRLEDRRIFQIDCAECGA